MKRGNNKDCIKERRNDQHNVKLANPQRAKRQAAPSLWHKLGEERLTQEVP